MTPNTFTPTRGEQVAERSVVDPAKTGTPNRAARPARTPSEFANLSRRMHELGLMRRRYGYYWTKLITIPIVLAASVVLFIWIGDTWWQMFIAAVFAVIFTQIAFLGHDAAHRQIFKSGKWNDWTSLIIANLGVGMSVGWWQSKHTKHHANPNRIGYDPDIEIPMLLPPAGNEARKRSKIAAWTLNHQGTFFFPVLFSEGVVLHVASFIKIFGPDRVKRRWLELALMMLRLGGFTALAFIVLSPGKAAVFLAIQLAAFGFYLGATFALNHMGMPIVPRDLKVDFLRRQVMTSRNIPGGRGIDFAMGGLNYQIEHHLFPSMPRPHLRKAAPIIAEFCREREIPYTVQNIGASFRSVVNYINVVGMKNRDPYVCPMVALRSTPMV